MRYRFTRGWASSLVCVGVTFIGAGIAAAILVFFLPFDLPALQALRNKIVVAIIAVVVGLVLGSPFIVSGQLLHVFLDQRELLATVARRVKRRPKIVPEIAKFLPRS